MLGQGKQMQIKENTSIHPGKISLGVGRYAKDQVRSLFLPIVLLKMRYENVKLQMRLNQGPNDDVDGHEMSKHSQEKVNCKLNLGGGMWVFFFPFLKISAVTYTTACARVRCCLLVSLGRPHALHIPPGLRLLPSFPCSPFCMSPAVLLSSSL